MIYPPNPTNGTIFRMQDGSYAVYEAVTNSWTKIIGYNTQPLATQQSSGLMPSSDLVKVNRIMLPYLKTTIKGENCSGRFEAGSVPIRGVDDFIVIDATPTVKAGGQSKNIQFKITKNIAGFDIRIDRQSLLKYLVDAGQVSLSGPDGKKGRTGPRGEDGKVYAAGIQGPKGNDGESLKCDLTINQEPNGVETIPGLNKAIVAIATNRIDDLNYEIVASRGVVGNPDASPSSVNVQCSETSPWLVVVQENTPTSQDTYYVDITEAVSEIDNRYKSELQRIKTGYENVVTFWVDKMSKLFSAQKASLCCSISQCEKINAASSTTTAAPSPALMAAIPAAASKSTATQFQNNGMAATIMGSNYTVSNSTVIELPPGQYAAKIISGSIKSGGKWYVSPIIDTDGSQFQIGQNQEYTNSSDAESENAGLTITLDHYGGYVRAYHNLPNANGMIVIQFFRIGDAKDKSLSLTRSNLLDVESAWAAGNCVGFITRILSQDYIVFRLDSIKSLGITGSASVAWPTLDGRTLTDIGQYTVVRNDRAESLVLSNLQNSVYTNHVIGVEIPTVDAVTLSRSVQPIVNYFSTILFPV